MTSGAVFFESYLTRKNPVGASAGDENRPSCHVDIDSLGAGSLLMRRHCGSELRLLEDSCFVIVEEIHSCVWVWLEQ